MGHPLFFFGPRYTLKSTAHFLLIIKYVNKTWKRYFPPNFVSVAALDLGKIGPFRAMPQKPRLGRNTADNAFEAHNSLNVTSSPASCSYHDSVVYFKRT